MQHQKHLQLHLKNQIAYLCFDRQGSGVNLFDLQVLKELDSLLHTVEHNDSLKGLIIHSAKPSIFIAGADIKTLSKAPLPEIKDLIGFGQSVFNRLADLKIPTVAAIHGACAGGGYELALACDWRVASTASSTKIGLPEVQLGLLPAWGGSTRLPQLLGLPNALKHILSGKLYKAKAAEKEQLVDALCPEENLLKLAENTLKKGKRSHLQHWKYHNPLSIAFIRHQAEKNLYKKTRGHYPAPQQALKVVCNSIKESQQTSMHHEEESFCYLIQQTETEQLLRLFFLTEKQKKLPIQKKATTQIKNTAVIGAGIMGSGIAYWLATRKKEVTLRDISAEAVAKGMGQIEKTLELSVKKHIIPKQEATHILDRIYPCNKTTPLYHSQLVIEAAVEEMEIKKTIFRELATLTEPDCILATNTSALPITELAKFNANPERVIGLHFFNPVPRMKLVEIIKTPYTSDQVLANAVSFITSIGKLPVIVKDSPGFLVNRILLPYLLAAGELFTKGHDPHELDQQMLDFGMPMGPLRLLDEIGLDVAQHVATTLCAAFPDRMKVPSILKTLIEKGHLGRKSKKGFYLYTNKKNAPELNPEAKAQQHTQPSPSKERAVETLTRLMSEEAQLCLDEKLVETADEIDFAMVMGTGYAPFRGGPLEYRKNKKI